MRSIEKIAVLGLATGVLVGASLANAQQTAPQWKVDFCAQKVAPTTAHCRKVCELKGLPVGDPLLRECLDRCEFDAQERFRACLEK